MNEEDYDGIEELRQMLLGIARRLNSMERRLELASTSACGRL